MTVVKKPSVFIGSSSEGLKAAHDIFSRCPRDNVMFELGLFMGRLGRSRTFIVCNTSEQLRLPSDLAGVTIAKYDENRADGNLIASVSPACTLIRTAMRDLGIYEGKSLYQLQKATNEMEGISDTVAHLVHLLARSRAVELDITASMFGPLLSNDFMTKPRRDLTELVESTKDRWASESQDENKSESEKT